MFKVTGVLMSHTLAVPDMALVCILAFLAPFLVVTPEPLPPMGAFLFSLLVRRVDGGDALNIHSIFNNLFYVKDTIK